LRQSAAAAPRIKDTHALLAEVYHQLGDAAAAAGELALLPELPDNAGWPDPFVEEVERLRTDVEGQAFLARQLLNHGRGREALQLLRETVQAHPDSPRAYLELGRAFMTLKDYATAAKVRQEAVRHDPDAFEARFDLGISFQRQAKFAEAAETYRRALALKPGHAFAHFNLSRCLREKGDRAGELQALRNTVRYKPEFAIAQRELGEALAKDGQPAAALVHLHHAVRLAPADARAKALLEQVRRHRPPGASGGREPPGNDF
jgi:tetratricopeptide (TPR) repeat protein